MSFNNVDLIEKSKGNWLDLARFIGIFCVVYGHCHPFTSEIDMGLRFIVYAFHMPIFFIISGWLELQPINYRKIINSLLIPFLIYNVIYFPLAFEEPLNFIKSLLCINVPPNDPTWFFVALALVKLIISCLKKYLNHLLLFSIIVYAVLTFLEIPLGQTLCGHAVITGIIFYVIGNRIKGYFTKSWILLNIPVSIILLFIASSTIERYDMFLGQCGNSLLYLSTAVSTAISILFICKCLSKVLPQSCLDWLKPISRGSMLIVGTHYIFAHFANQMIFPAYNMLVIKLIYSLILIVIYRYIIINTYNRIPIIYGKYTKK